MDGVSVCRVLGIQAGKNLDIERQQPGARILWPYRGVLRVLSIRLMATWIRLKMTCLT